VTFDKPEVGAMLPFVGDVYSAGGAAGDGVAAIFGSLQVSSDS
jgi:hypothetical protein